MMSSARLQTEVMAIALDQCGPATDRKIALIDKNKDLYLTFVRRREQAICQIGKRKLGLVVL